VCRNCVKSLTRTIFLPDPDDTGPEWTPLPVTLATLEFVRMMELMEAARQELIRQGAIPDWRFYPAVITNLEGVRSGSGFGE